MSNIVVKLRQSSLPATALGKARVMNRKLSLAMLFA